MIIKINSFKKKQDKYYILSKFLLIIKEFYFQYSLIIYIL